MDTAETNVAPSQLIKSDVEFSWSTYLPAILVAGLGFLVDVYDVLLFAVLRVPSLIALGVPESQTLTVGVNLMNAQMVGLVLGGVIWGAIGDKKGRRAALFGSILVYSVASILNSFVTSVPMYAFLRFVTGFGLAGEVGAAMTIAAEITPAKYRTYGTAAISLLGVFGSLLASYVGATMPWRMAFFIAGIAGLVLLFIRISMKETALFEKAKKLTSSLDYGSLSMVLKSPARLIRMFRCVFAALPLFFVFGVLVTFSPEIHSGGIDAATLVAKVAMFYSIGEILGEAASSVLSQIFRSRRGVIFLFQICGLITTGFVLRSDAEHYALPCVPLGFLVGYWAEVITTTAEQFGTNVRSTVTTIVPNLMRACHIPINLAFSFLAAKTGTSSALLILALASYLISFLCVMSMKETFAKDLDFVESNVSDPI